MHCHKSGFTERKENKSLADAVICALNVTFPSFNCFHTLFNCGVVTKCIFFFLQRDLDIHAPWMNWNPFDDPMTSSSGHFFSFSLFFNTWFECLQN